MIDPGSLRFLVPGEWSADQALCTLELLVQARRAICAVHGESMAAALSDDRERCDQLEDLV